MADKWHGFKEVMVKKIVKEDENVKSFYVENLDKSSLPDYLPGQFIGVKIKDKNGEFTLSRQYTLSTDYQMYYYRISVKREEDGYLSKKLCDELNEGDIIYITAPMGNFVLKDSKNPVVLIGAGIGITPMLTMAYAASEKNREVFFFYSTRNSNNNALEYEVRKLGHEKQNVHITILYTRPTEEDKKNHNFHKEGRINAQYLEENVPKDGEFYFCGPFRFMKALYKYLKEIGIKREHINYELFSATLEKIEE